MAKLTSAQIQEKWSRNLSNAIPSIKAGVQAVTESPTQKAASQVDRYVRGVQEAAQTGTWQEGLNSVTLEDWKMATAEKGTARIADGVAKAKTKMQRFFDQLLPHTDMVRQTISGMPKGTEQDSDARMLAASRLMRQFKFRKR